MLALLSFAFVFLVSLLASLLDLVERAVVARHLKARYLVSFNPRDAQRKERKQETRLEEVTPPTFRA